MKRYFFDYVTKNRTVHDFKGKEFHSAHAAYEAARLHAVDLQASPKREWTGWKIAVRDALGQELHSIPV